MSDANRRLCFLIGAGVSMAAGLPAGSEITAQVLSGDDIMWHSDEVFYFGKPLFDHMGWDDEAVPRVTRLLAAIQRDLASLHEKLGLRVPSFEEIYFVVQQLCAVLLGDYENIVIQDYVNRIDEELTPCYRAKDHEIKRDWNLSELARVSENYILDIIWHMLNRPETDLRSHSFLTDACKEDSSSRPSIFSLNYDTVIEQALTESGILYKDGFGSPVNSVRYWSPDELSACTDEIKLFKLHGSVNWFRLRSGGEQAIDRIASVSGDHRYTVGPDGERQIDLGGRPLIIAGTVNKMMRYTSDIFGALSCMFWQELNASSNLVVSGYSFNDKGINNRIVDWLYSPEFVGKMVVIHPDPAALVNDARPAIQRVWKILEHEERLAIIDKPIQDTSWEEIGNSLKR